MPTIAMRTNGCLAGVVDADERADRRWRMFHVKHSRARLVAPVCSPVIALFGRRDERLPQLSPRGQLIRGGLLRKSNTTEKGGAFAAPPVETTGTGLSSRLIAEPGVAPRMLGGDEGQKTIQFLRVVVRDVDGPSPA